MNFTELLTYHIKFYLKQGFELEMSIKRGYEEAVEEAFTRIYHGDNTIEGFYPQSPKETGTPE